jgi:hypothetical protein
VGFIQKSQNSLLFICDYCLKHHSVPQFGAFERTLLISQNRLELVSKEQRFAKTTLFFFLNS